MLPTILIGCSLNILEWAILPPNTLIWTLKTAKIWNKIICYHAWYPEPPLSPPQLLHWTNIIMVKHCQFLITCWTLGIGELSTELDDWTSNMMIKNLHGIFKWHSHFQRHGKIYFKLVLPCWPSGQHLLLI